MRPWPPHPGSIEALTSAGWENLDVMHGATVGWRVFDWGLGTRTGVMALRFNCTASLQPGVPATLAAFSAYLGAPLP